MALRNTLKKSATGQSVIELQKLLNKVLPQRHLVTDGDFGQQTRSAVIDFQRKATLSADGIVGRNTWVALAYAMTSVVPINNENSALSDIAKEYLGVKETGNNFAGDSVKMLEIFNADDLFVRGETDGYPWCSTFVSMCVQKLCQADNTFSTITPPREPSVSRFLNRWAKNNNCLIFKPSSKVFFASKGDIVVFTFSHIGIVDSNDGDLLNTIEGNTNEAGSREGVTVAKKARRQRLIKFIIRLPITTNATETKLNNAMQYC